MGRPKNPLAQARSRWAYNKRRQEGLGRQFLISFEDWYAWWLSHGVDKNLPVKPMSRETLVLVRVDETKPYTIDNIQAATHGESTTHIKSNTKGKQRPQTWVIKDPVLHELYMPFLKARSQAWYLGQDWSLSFEEFAQVWGDKWSQRGRASHCYSMSRIDIEKGWSVDNVALMTRGDYRRLHNKAGRKRKKRMTA